MSVRLMIFQRGFKLILSFILAGIFLVFWSKVAKGHLDAIDRTLLLAFRSPRNSDILTVPDWLLPFVRNITVLGDSTFLLLVIFAVTFFLVVKRAYLNALLLTVPLARLIADEAIGIGKRPRRLEVAVGGSEPFAVRAGIAVVFAVVD